MPEEEKEEKERTKASVYMNPEEYKSIRKGAVDTGMKVSHYLLGLVRLGKAFLGEYDWQDALAKFRGEETDRDWIKAETKAMQKGVSLEEYQRRLRSRLEANKQTRRFCEIQAEIIEEELDEVEHLLEKTKK